LKNYPVLARQQAAWVEQKYYTTIPQNGGTGQSRDAIQREKQWFDVDLLLPDDRVHRKTGMPAS
jgi:hypothetical protein